MSTVNARMRHERRLRRLMNLPRQVSGMLLVLAGLVIALGMPSSCHGAVAGPAAIAQQAPDTWVPTGSLNTARWRATATLLANGKVLVVGGRDTNDNPLSSAELYDPATGAWSVTPPMHKYHYGHTATLLSDGRVLVVGGEYDAATTAEIYDPAAGTWNATGNLTLRRVDHTATLLNDGKVLVAGGLGADLAELYDPSTGMWSTTGALNVPRSGHTATLLPDGQVLLVGGSRDGQTPALYAELYDPTSGEWGLIAGPNLPRLDHTATLLPNGMVLVAGGFTRTIDPDTFAASTTSTKDAELYDPSTRTWADTGALGVSRSDHTATLLADGEVLVAAGATFGPGGYDPGISTEVYDFTTATWRNAASLITARAGHVATLLPDGRVLVAGGCCDPSPPPRGLAEGDAIASAETYRPSLSQTAIIGPAFTGAWYDPAQSGHGIFLEILPSNHVFLGWFTFNPAGTQQVWFGGIGSYIGNTATISAVDMPTGGRWIPNFDPTKIVHNAWGTLTLTFTDRDHGRIDFNSTLGFGSGSMNLSRLTQPAGLTPLSTAIGPPGAVVADGFGNVYFSSPNIVFKLDAQGNMTRVAGNGTSGFSGDGGPATQALLSFPSTYPEQVADPIDFSDLIGALAVDAAGNLFIADAYNNRVRKVDGNGIITTVAGRGTKGYSGDGGPATQAQFWWPQGVGFDSVGDLYVADSNGTLRRIDGNGVISTLLGNNCGSFLQPGLCGPEQIAIDANDNVYAPDLFCRVRKNGVTIAGNDHTEDLAHNGAYTCGYAGDGGPAVNAAMSIPYAVAVDQSSLYIADTYNSCIRRVDASGIISTFAGVCQNTGYSGDGGPATQARLSRPKGVAVDTAGNVYIADTENDRIRKVSPSGIISTIAGDGSQRQGLGPGYTGAWYDPAQSGHGIFLEILPGNSAFLGWFTFDPAGTQQVWFGGVGSNVGSTVRLLAVDQPTGGRWIPNFDPNQIVHNPWGSLTVTFTDCNHGAVNFSSTSGYGMGSMNLARLTQPAGLTCP